MRCNRVVLLAVHGLFVVLVSVPTPVAAQWQTVGRGIEYQKFRALGDTDVYVTRMARSEQTAIIDSVVSSGGLTGTGGETVNSMAARPAQVGGFWGGRWRPGTDYKVVVAINGDMGNMTTGEPAGGQIASGWYVKRFPNFNRSGFAFTMNRDVFIGDCVTHSADKQVVTFGSNGPTQELNGINRARGGNEMVLYSRHYSAATPAVAGFEILVNMETPAQLQPAPAFSRGTIVSAKQGNGATPIGQHQIVLSASGNTATTLLPKAHVGGEVLISQEIHGLDANCQNSSPADWTQTYASVGGNWVFLRNGAVVPITGTGADKRDPRTAIAYNDQYIFFIVVDGDMTPSVGFNMAQMGAFCRDQLKARDGVNQDGGGSSTMWVMGEVKNRPWDVFVGHLDPRPVPNAMLMINLPEEANSIDGGIGAGDGGMRADDAATDGSTNDTDATPDQTSGSKSSGCKCNMPGDISGAVGSMILAGLLFLMQRRRRR